MKKFLGILVLSLLFISIDLINPTTVKATIFHFIERKVNNTLDYFEKRKKCQEWADRMDTVAIGKKRYKSCMEE